MKPKDGRRTTSRINGKTAIPLDYRDLNTGLKGANHTKGVPRPTLVCFY